MVKNIIEKVLGQKTKSSQIKKLIDIAKVDKPAKSTEEVVKNILKE